MAKKPVEEMTEQELAQEMGGKPVTDWSHHAAKAELERRHRRDPAPPGRLRAAHESQAPGALDRVDARPDWQQYA